MGFLGLLAFSAPESAFIKWSFPLGMGLGLVFGSSVGKYKNTLKKVVLESLNVE